MKCTLLRSSACLRACQEELHEKTQNFAYADARMLPEYPGFNGKWVMFQHVALVIIRTVQIFNSLLSSLLEFHISRI